MRWIPCQSFLTLFSKPVKLFLIGSACAKVLDWGGEAGKEVKEKGRERWGKKRKERRREHYTEDLLMYSAYMHNANE